MIVTSDGVAVPVRFVVRLVGSFPMSDGDRDASSKFVRRNVRRLSERKHSVDHPPSNTVFYWPTVSTVMLWSTGHATYDTLRYNYEYDNKNSLYHTCIRSVAVPRCGQTGARAPAVKPCTPAVPRQLSYGDVDHKRISSLRGKRGVFCSK